MKLIPLEMMHYLLLLFSFMGLNASPEEYCLRNWKLCPTTLEKGEHYEIVNLHGIEIGLTGWTVLRMVPQRIRTFKDIAMIFLTLPSQVMMPLNYNLFVKDVESTVIYEGDSVPDDEDIEVTELNLWMPKATGKEDDRAIFHGAEFYWVVSADGKPPKVTAECLQEVRVAINTTGPFETLQLSRLFYLDIENEYWKQLLYKAKNREAEELYANQNDFLNSGIAHIPDLYPVRMPDN